MQVELSSIHIQQRLMTVSQRAKNIDNTIHLLG